MDDIHAFATGRTDGRPMAVRRFRSETDLRRFVVRHAQTLLGVTILAIEYPIATNGTGRIDALGIDRKRIPVVVEFKRAATGTSICQGLYYLDWLEGNRDLFSMLVMDQLGQKAAARINWNSPRLLCLAEEIGEREEAVARQIGRTVELLQIRRLSGGLVMVQRPPTRLPGNLRAA